MNYLSFLLIPIVVGLVFTGIKKDVLNREKNMDENNFVIRQSRVVFWVGIICLFVFSVLIVVISIFPDETVDFFTYAVFSLFLCLGLGLTLHSLSWSVRITGGEMQLNTMFKRGETYTFAMLDKAVMKKQNTPAEQLILYANSKKLFAVDKQYSGYHVLLSRLINEQIKFDVR